MVSKAQWQGLIASRRKVLAALSAQGALVGKAPAALVGDALDTPPAAGQETSWLSSLVADAKAKLAEAKTWAASKIAAAKERARAALSAIVDLMRKAEATANALSDGPLGSPSPAQIASDAKAVLSDASAVMSTIQQYSTPLLLLALALLWAWKSR